MAIKGSVLDNIKRKAMYLVESPKGSWADRAEMGLVIADNPRAARSRVYTNSRIDPSTAGKSADYKVAEYYGPYTPPQKNLMNSPFSFNGSNAPYQTNWTSGSARENGFSGRDADFRWRYLHDDDPEKYGYPDDFGWRP